MKAPVGRQDKTQGDKRSAEPWDSPPQSARARQGDRGLFFGLVVFLNWKVQYFLIRPQGLPHLDWPLLRRTGRKK